MKDESNRKKIKDLIAKLSDLYGQEELGLIMWREAEHRLLTDLSDTLKDAGIADD